MSKIRNREQWAKAALDMICHEIIAPQTQLPVPLIRVSVAMLSPKTLGECYPRSRSADQHNEIFIAAHTDDSFLHLATLAHEAIHAFDDCSSGHKGEFARVARQIGLEGKLTATTVSTDSKLHALLVDIHNHLGDIPHAKISKKVKDSGNRNGYKLACDDCGFKANTSKKHAARIVSCFPCPACGGTNTAIHTPT